MFAPEIDKLSIGARYARHMEPVHIEAYRRLPPLQVTLPQLRAVLLPITAGYAWGESTIVDLWTMGAPTPDSTADHEVRIVFPGQLAKWLADVLERQGRPLDATAKIYAELRMRGT